MHLVILYVNGGLQGQTLGAPAELSPPRGGMKSMVFRYVIAIHWCGANRGSFGGNRRVKIRNLDNKRGLLWWGHESVKKLPTKRHSAQLSQHQPPRPGARNDVVLPTWWFVMIG